MILALVVAPEAALELDDLVELGVDGVVEGADVGLLTSVVDAAERRAVAAVLRAGPLVALGADVRFELVRAVDLGGRLALQLGRLAWKNGRICAASFGTPGSSSLRSSVALPRELSSGFCGARWRPARRNLAAACGELQTVVAARLVLASLSSGSAAEAAASTRVGLVEPAEHGQRRREC